MSGFHSGGWARWIPAAAVIVSATTVAPLCTHGGSLGNTSHEVKRSETLSGIARKYGVSVREIISTNQLPGPRARLQVGSRLKIPEGSRLKIPEGNPGERMERGSRRIARSGSGVRRASLRSSSVRDVFAPQPPDLSLSIPDFGGPIPDFSWPVDGAISSNFGRRWRSWHRGVDIVAHEGAPIHAAAPGVVIASGLEPRYGRVVKIEHDGGFVTVYAHNLANSVEVGYRVAAGQEIGQVGQTGRATSAHLHFEIRYDGRVVNPLYLLPLPPRVATEQSAVEPEDDDE